MRGEREREREMSLKFELLSPKLISIMEHITNRQLNRHKLLFRLFHFQLEKYTN